MEELRPFLVTAPLTINCADVLDTETIYVFDYENSFNDVKDKPNAMIRYLESLGGMFDLFVSPNVSYEDKEQLILNYFDSGSFMNVYTLVETLVHCLFYYKQMPYSGKRSIFTNADCQRFISTNGNFMKEMVSFYDSMFVVMLLYAGQPTKDMKKVREHFTSEQIVNTELSPNVCTLLLDSYFYEYYSKHVGKDIMYYEFLFENNLYKGMSFIDIITNKNNNLLPVLLDLTNPKFLDFIQQKKES